MKVELNREQLDKLHEICRKFDADEGLIDKVREGVAASHEVSLLCELINNEFLSRGIDQDFEANDYGREMEALLDLVNSVRLRRV